MFSLGCSTAGYARKLTEGVHSTHPLRFTSPTNGIRTLSKFIESLNLSLQMKWKLSFHSPPRRMKKSKRNPSPLFSETHKFHLLQNLVRMVTFLSHVVQFHSRFLSTQKNESYDCIALSFQFSPVWCWNHLGWDEGWRWCFVPVEAQVKLKSKLWWEFQSSRKKIRFPLAVDNAHSNRGPEGNAWDKLDVLPRKDAPHHDEQLWPWKRWHCNACATRRATWMKTHKRFLSYFLFLVLSRDGKNVNVEYEDKFSTFHAPLQRDPHTGLKG